jgi:hypothetical protein
MVRTLCFEGKPVAISTAVGPRNGKTTIVKITRAPVDVDNAALDAEIAARDAAVVVL